MHARTRSSVPASGDDASLPAIAEELARRQRVLIGSHANGDGDSIGASLALARVLVRLRKSAAVLLPDWPEKYRFLAAGGGDVLYVHPQKPESLDAFDLGVFLDASQPERSGAIEATFFNAAFPKLCIDHHLDPPPPGIYALRRCDVGAPATGSLILQLVDALKAPLDAAIAEALFVAIATDTGWFRHSNTQAQVFRDMARLVDAGARPERLYERLYEELSPARVALQGKVLERMRVDLDGALVWSALDRDAIRSAAVPREDFEGLIDPLRCVRGHRVVAFLTESEPGTWKISLRSRGGVSVQSIASRLGGGGHRQAAGCKVAGTLETVVETLRSLVKSELEAPQ
jgi:phosphoesterase RecJ-like protein